jgi:uncharacterized protein YjbI with pentapeptide repeats
MSWLNTLRGLLQHPFPREESRHPDDGEELDQRPRKLTREDVLRLIEENGGPEGLDLSGQDLSWIDLGQEAVQREAARTSDRSGERPSWQSERTGGIALHGAVLNKANLSGANLSFADFHHASLDGARLNAASLTRARLRFAHFRNTDLRWSNLNGAMAPGANFEGANMGAANLSGTVFDEASLRGASLYKARLSGTIIGRRELGDGILQETPSDTKALLERYHPNIAPELIEGIVLQQPLEDARQVYAALKANFIETGNYQDASWAHIKERQMARKTHHPKHAKNYYADEFPKGRALLSLGWWGFYLRHTAKWLLDWAAELTCGYGEKPLRTVLWAGIALLVFPFVYRWSNGIIAAAGTMSWLDYFNYSFGAFTTFGFDRFQAVTPLAQTLTSIEALLGISTLALLMFTLGNRISRS